MENTKNDTYFIKKILSELEFIVEHTKDKTLEDIANDVLLIKSIMFSLIQIFENNEKLSNQFKEKHNEISWKAMKGMRNRIVHDYGTVNMEIVYHTVKVSVPEFVRQLKDI